MLVGLHEQIHAAELQDQELAGLQGSPQAAWVPDGLVRSGTGLGAATERKARPAGATSSIAMTNSKGFASGLRQRETGPLC